MPDVKTAPRRKLPKELAVIYADRCTGCEACIEVCPADCIVKVDQYADAPGLQAFCEIDWDACIGCKLCVRLPTAKADAYQLLVCPWEAIEMVPVGRLSDMLDRIGGPPQYAAENRRRLVQAAERQEQLASAASHV